MRATKKIYIFSNPNNLVTIVGRDMGQIAANNVEAIFDFSSKEGKELFASAIQENRYVRFIADQSKIKCLVLMNNGKVYPSTFTVPTLHNRIKEATTLEPLKALEKGESADEEA
mgnify:CR=1 FL=1